jgi:hypothetical protein
MMNIALLLSLASAATAQTTTSYPAIPGQKLSFTDTFESSTDFAWTMFEEVVNSCANTGAGAVVRNTTMRKAGLASLEVMSNAAKVAGSNHVLAQRKLANVGVTGRFSYQTFAYVDPDVLPLTQTGPEFSLQSTLPIGLTTRLEPIMRTIIGGIQYVGSKFVTNKWNLWVRTSGASAKGEVAEWVSAAGALPDLISEKGWWKLTLVMDFHRRKYISASFVSPSGNSSKVMLTSYPIAREVKFTDGALGATLEAQNLYDCQGVHVHNAFYDDVCILQTQGIVPVAVSVDAKTSTLFAGENDTWALPSTMRVIILQVPTKGKTSITNSTILYKARAPGGDSVKIKACDKTTFLCTEAWWTIASANRAPTGQNMRVDTRQCGTVISIASPITDPDGNLDVASAQILSGAGVVDLVSSPGVVKFKFDLTGKSGKGELGFQVKVCDVQPWGWCASAWIVVAWDCLAI